MKDVQELSRIDSCNARHDKNWYVSVIADAYRSGYSLDLPELEVFGVGEVNMEAVSEFTFALVDFIERKEQEADEEDLEYLYHFGESIHADFFSASPSLINYIRLPDRLKLMTRATRSKVIQGTFGSVFVGETVYDVSFMKGRLDEVAIKAMNDLSVPEKLDLLHQLRTVGAQAIANGEWARPAYNQVRQTYETCMKSEDSTVFVQLAAEAGLETLDKEYENPQLGVVRFKGQTSDSRLDTRFSDEQVTTITNKFFSTYSLDQVVSHTALMLPATKDSLICMDRSGLASGVIKINVPEFLSASTPELDFDVNQYRLYKQQLEAAEHFPDLKRHDAIVSLYHAIYNEYVEDFLVAGDIENPAKVFAKILPILSEQEWRVYFAGELKHREYPSKDKLYSEVADENGRVSYEFVTSLFQYSDQLGEEYEDDFFELETALEDEDLEYAFECASRICRRSYLEQEEIAIELKVAALWLEFESESRIELLRGLSTLEEIEQERQKLRKYIEERVGDHVPTRTQFNESDIALRRTVASLEAEVSEAHQANFAAAENSYNAGMNELLQSQEIRARAEVVTKIEANLDALGEKLRTLIESKLAIAEDLPQLELISFKSLVAELKGYTNSDKVSEEDVLLFQHVHSDDLSRKIETSFGFLLSELTTQEQFYFLNYLKHTTVLSAETIKVFIQSYGVTGMRTFLALEQGGKELGDKIVTFGQYPELAEKVFRHYTELLDTALNAEELVRTRLGEEADIETTKQTINAVRADILDTAQRDLERAVKAGDPHEISKKIETFSASARVYVTLLKEVARTPLESIPAVSLGDNFKTAARRLSEQNYVNETPEFQAVIQKSLDDAFLRNNTRFYTEVDSDGQVIFFDRFDDMVTEEGKKITYFGSVNSDPAYAGIGKMRIGETLEKELSDCDVMFAHCDPRNPISQFYIEHGFIATQTVAPAGKFSFEIWRSKDSSQTLKTKSMTQEELVVRADTSMSANSDYFVREVISNDPFHELDDGLGYLMTRYFIHDGKTYAAFEINTDLSKQFVPPAPKQ